MYIWELQGWPGFTWDAVRIGGHVAAARIEQDRLQAKLDVLDPVARALVEMEAIVSEVIETSRIEGEILNPVSVRASAALQLGQSGGISGQTDGKVDGLVAMMLDVTRNHAAPMTSARLFGWQSALFPDGYSGLSEIDVGRWRGDSSGAMQVVSGGSGRTKVHFEAPPAARLQEEMDRFLEWFEADQGLDGIVKAGIAHLWFVTVHPLDDGNGRCARAVADLAAARAEGNGLRYHSVSSAIARVRADYYDLLEATQKGDLDITDWLCWFVDRNRDAVIDSRHVAEHATAKVRLLEKGGIPGLLTGRQAKVVHRLLGGFEGHLTARKYAAMGKCSQDEAIGDIDDLVGKGFLVGNEGGGKHPGFSLDMRAVARDDEDLASARSGPGM